MGMSLFEKLQKRDDWTLAAFILQLLVYTQMLNKSLPGGQKAFTMYLYP